MAEFCILPRYRRKGLGLEAVRRLFAGHPGRREVKYPWPTRRGSGFGTVQRKFMNPKK